MATAANHQGNGGAGGKFRKKPFRRNQSTPYDRPVTALRPAQAAAETGGWLSKFVDPASKLITAGAHKLFSSVFRKRLLPPPTPSQHSPDENMDVKALHPEATSVLAPSGTKEHIVCGGDDPSKVSGNNGVAELEDILKQRTFTRYEIDHLMDLLQARTADDSGIMKRSEAKLSDQQPIHVKNDNHTYSPINENITEHVVPGAISTPVVRSKVVEEDTASPAELAKVYMGSRPRIVSPSVLGLHKQNSRESLSATNNSPFKLRSPTSSLFQRSDVGTSENGFSVPRLRGKSAIYSMARTPYSRIHPAATVKASGTVVDANGGTFSSKNTTHYNQLDGSNKQVLKRRSSVLENDIGSVGPIRRIRQKPNLLHPKFSNPSAFGVSNATHVAGMHSDAIEYPSSSNRNPSNHSSPKFLADNNMPSTSSGYVPSQSIETAQKIFQQLDKFTPNEKSSELKPDAGGIGSLNKMTPTLLGGRARRSMETVDSLKVLQSGLDNKEKAALSTTVDLALNGSLRIEDANQKTLVAPSDKMSHSDSEVVAATTRSSENNNVVDVFLRSGLVHAPKKRAFQMSAHEDYLEMEDDVQVNGVASTATSEGEEVTKVSQKSTAMLNIRHQNEAIVEEKPAASNQKPSGILILRKEESEPLSDGPGPATDGKTTGFTFPVVSSSSSANSLGVQVANTVPQSASVFDKVVSQNESDNAVTASGKSDKLPTHTFPTTPSLVESAVRKDSKLELPDSANHTVAIANGPTENDKVSSQEVSEVVRKSKDDSSPFTSTAKGIFNFGSPANKATVTSGLSSTASATSTSPPAVLFSGTSTVSASVTFAMSSPIFTGDSSLSNGFTASTSTSTTSSAAGIMGSASSSSGLNSIFGCSSQQSSSVVAPSVYSGPIFQFGTPTVSSNSAAPSSASESGKDSGVTLGTTFGNSSSNNLFSNKPSPATTAGSSVFSFNASSLRTASAGSQAAASTAASGPIFGFQASSTTAAAPVSAAPTPSFPIQFSSSSSSPVFGLSGTTGLSSGASMFSANTFSTGTASGSISLGASSSMGSSVSSSTTAAPSIFGSSWQFSSKSTIPTFGTSSPSTGLSFGTSPLGSSTDSNKTSVVFGASSTSNSSAAAAGNSSPFIFGAANTSAAPPVFSFSSTATATSTPFSSTTPAFVTTQSFGNPTTQSFAFGSNPIGNNDQMTMEDSMAEDNVQASTPATPVFNQPPPISAPSTGFMFGATPSSSSFGGATPPSSMGNPFQFGGQQNQMAPQQTPSPFQPSGSVEFNAGGGAGSFSLGTTGDKSNRKFVKVRGRARKK